MLQGSLFLANAQELLGEPATDQLNMVDQSRHKENTEKNFIKRHRLMSHNKGVLNAKKQTLTLTLFKDTKYTLDLVKVDAEGVENTWTGTVRDVPMSNVELYYDGEHLEGRIDIGTQLYILTPMDGLTLINEIDKNTVPMCRHQQFSPSHK